MIARIHGRIITRRPEFVVVDVGGVGYRLFVSLNTFYDLPEPGAEATLLVHTVVRDDAIHLYGFSREPEKAAFGQLIGVSGIGPKVALSVLSGITPDELWLAVKSRDLDRLCKVPGVGKKTAARLVVDLEGRLPQSQAAPESAPVEAKPPLVSDAVSALTNLGYPEPKASKAVERALAALDADPALEVLLREALKQFK
ncbi:MAG: Holliday junction branch migration protein RuvA [Pseudomonadota bacterium]